MVSNPGFEYETGCHWEYEIIPPALWRLRWCTCKRLAWDLGSLLFFRRKFCIESMGRSQFYSLDTPFLILSLIFSHLCNRMNNFLFQKFSARCSHENSRAALSRKCWAGSLGMWGPRSLRPWDQDVTQLAGGAGRTPSRWLAVPDVWVKELSLQIHVSERVWGRKLNEPGMKNCNNAGAECEKTGGEKRSLAALLRSCVESLPYDSSNNIWVTS